MTVDVRHGLFSQWLLLGDFILVLQCNKGVYFMNVYCFTLFKTFSFSLAGHNFSDAKEFGWQVPEKSKTFSEIFGILHYECV